MLRRIRNKLCVIAGKLRFIPKCYILVPVLMLASAIVIRAATGGTHIIYAALDGRGIFPGPFLYNLFYMLRVILFSIILTFCLFSRNIYEERFRAVLATVLGACMLLLEYKLIFGGVSLVLALAFAALISFLSAFSIITVKYKNRCISVIMLSFVFLQTVHFIQLISLAFCI